MVAVFIALVVYLRIVKNAINDPAVRGLLIAVAAVIGIGTMSYSFLEDWSLINALYFSVVSLLTVGYGDYAPTTDGAKLFTVGYLLTSVGIVATAATTIVQRSRTWVAAEEQQASN
jgi:hypothetical protein